MVMITSHQRRKERFRRLSFFFFFSSFFGFFVVAGVSCFYFLSFVCTHTPKPYLLFLQPSVLVVVPVFGVVVSRSIDAYERENGPPLV